VEKKKPTLKQPASHPQAECCPLVPVNNTLVTVDATLGRRCGDSVSPVVKSPARVDKLFTIKASNGAALGEAGRLLDAGRVIVGKTPPMVGKSP
jgi:hypothetical protein